jgi:hypothetical protein
MKIIGIRRDKLFSPGSHAENDSLIFDLVAEYLAAMGWHVQLLDEHDVGRAALGRAVVFSMCQGSRANGILAGLEAQGTLIINSPVAAQNCYRSNLHRVAGSKQNNLVSLSIVSTQGDGLAPLPSGHAAAFWVKRGDVHATQKGDVVKVRGEQEYGAVLADFRRRGISCAAVEPHIEGEVVKFYGVVDSPFFSFYCERNPERIPDGFRAARPEIEALIRQVGLEIYGGDAVMTRDGRIVVIDVNDWPSFARFRDQAASVIAQHIHRRATEWLADVPFPDSALSRQVV